MSNSQATDFFDEIAALRPLLFRLAHLELQDKASAEDAAQEAVLAALEGLDRFEGRSSVKTWLISILRFKVLDILRAKKRLRPVADAAGLKDELDLSDFDGLFEDNGCWATEKDSWSDPQSNFERVEFFEILEACLTHLPSNSARVFLMREWLELASSEISERTDLTPGNIRVLLYRARMQLRTCLDKNWMGSDVG